MIVALSLTLLGLIAVLFIANQLERAPEAFEDEHGFHGFARSPRPESQVSAPPIGAAREVVG